jgi:hypothetical protein
MGYIKQAISLHEENLEFLERIFYSDVSFSDSGGG